MRIVIISDTHGFEESMVEKVPDGDVLIHAGDFTKKGEVLETTMFVRWFERQPHKHKIFISGNHDFLAQRNYALFTSLVKDCGVNYLQDSEIEIDGVKFYGSPWTPWFYNWAFNLDECSPFNRGLYDAMQPTKKFMSSERCWSMVPKDVDVLITHGPAYGVLDELETGGNVGCPVLLDRLNYIDDLKLHCFGHIHHSYGITMARNGNGHSYFAVNAAVCDERYRPVNKPIVINLNL